MLGPYLITNESIDMFVEHFSKFQYDSVLKNPINDEYYYDDNILVCALSSRLKYGFSHCVFSNIFERTLQLNDIFYTDKMFIGKGICAAIIHLISVLRICDYILIPSKIYGVVKKNISEECEIYCVEDNLDGYYVISK